MTTAELLRSFLLHLVDPAAAVEDPEAARGALLSIASSVIWNKGGGPEASELIADFTVRMLEKPKETLRRDVSVLLEMPDAGLVGTLRHRLRQLAAERRPRAEVRKSLREHVRAAWEAAGAARHALPAEVRVAGRFSSELVVQAVSYFRHDPEFAHLRQNEVADHLLDLFLPPDAGVEDLAEEQLAEAIMGHESLETRVRRKYDALEAAGMLHEALGPELADVVVRRMNGETFASIAAARGLSGPPAAFTRFERAKAILQEQFGTVRISRRSAMLALHFVGMIAEIPARDGQPHPVPRASSGS
jgi:hypothetical protein